MNKLISLVLLSAFIIAALIILPLNVTALGAYQPTKPNLEELVEFYAKEYSVSKDLVFYIVENESSWNSEAIGDMNLTCERNNKPVRARGLWQITECYFPEITDKQAFDPVWSTKWSIKMLSDGGCKLWTTCRNYYGM